MLETVTEQTMLPIDRGGQFHRGLPLGWQCGLGGQCHFPGCLGTPDGNVDGGRLGGEIRDDELLCGTGRAVGEQERLAERGRYAGCRRYASHIAIIGP